MRRMDFAILRIQKLKSAVAVRSSLKHAFRDQETPNADLARTPNNSHVGAKNTQEAISKFNAGLPDKIRKNAVLCLEYLITASADFMKRKSRASQDKYFSDSLAYLHKIYGKENVFYAGVHRDESTPHMYAYVLPKHEGKLNARHYIGGHKDRMSEMQTEFAESVGKKHGLERGVKGSRARHQKIKDYYAKVNAKTPEIAPAAVPRRGLLEKHEDYSRRVVREVGKSASLRTLSAKAKSADDAIERASVLKQAIDSQRISHKQIDAQRLREIQELQARLAMQEKALLDLKSKVIAGGDALQQERFSLLKPQTQTQPQAADKPSGLKFRP